MRSDREITADRLLLLYSVSKTNEYGRMEGPFKLQKIPFASELDMNTNKTRGFNYSFFRYDYGPLSKEIYDDGAELHKAGLITSLKGPIELTDEGKQIVSSLSELYRKNEQVTDYIDGAAKKYARMSFGRLRRHIYALQIEWAGDAWKVGEIPMHCDMMDALPYNDARVVFELDDDWVDSLWGVLRYSAEDAKKLQVVRKAVAV